MAGNTLTGASSAPNTSVSMLSVNSDKQSSGVQKVKNFAIAGFMAVGINFVSPYAAKAEEVAIIKEEDKAACIATTKADTQKLRLQLVAKNPEKYGTEEGAAKLDVAMLKRENAALDTCMTDLQQKAEIAAKDAEIAGKDERISKLNVEIAQQEEKIVQGKTEIAQQEEKIVQLDTSIAEVRSVKSDARKLSAEMRAKEKFFTDFVSWNGSPEQVAVYYKTLKEEIPGLVNRAKTYIAKAQNILVDNEDKVVLAQLSSNVSNMERILKETTSIEADRIATR